VAAQGGRTRVLDVAEGLRQSHGARSTGILVIATLVLNGAGYLYNIACIRYLGPGRYGDIAAMVAMAALVALPLGSLQSLLAREVASLETRGSFAAVARLFRRSLRIATPIGLALFAIGLALVDPIREALKIGSTSTVVAGLSMLLLAVEVAVLYGFLQGLQRFWPLALTYAISGLFRPLLVVPVLLAGLGAAGALTVNTAAAVVAVLMAGVALRDLWGRKADVPAPHLQRGEVAIVFVGSLAFASLTNVDILLAKYFLSDDEAGIYAAAALVGKFVLFLPSAAVTVLLPKATSRSAAGIRPHRILLLTAGVTGALTLTAAGALALMPESLLVWAFGPAFREATGLLGWFGLAMTAGALVNVYLAVYFAERDVRFPLIVAAAAVAQIIGIALFHSEPLDLVLTTLVCFTAVLVIHELKFRYGLVRVWARSRQVEAL
jgi:O-antigen/teichoic acid export membrane protein